MPSSPASLERRSGASLVALGAAAGGAFMVVTSSGDALFLGVLLGLAARDALAGGVGVLAGIGVIGRWGTTSLAAAAGGQAVLGPAGWTDSTALILSSWGAAVALVLVAPGPERPVGAGSTGPERPVGAGSTGPERPVGAGGKPLAVLAFGLLAAMLVAGPAVGELSAAGPLAVRLLASLLRVAAAWLGASHLPRSIARPAGLAIAVAAMFLSFAG